MARPIKCRRVDFFPDHNYFVPVGVSKCKLEDMELKVEELEAMRLKDIENLNQDECAKRMEISRQTFQNVIDSARKKVAIALTEGKAIHISGGQYTTHHCKFSCNQCDTVYGINYQQDRSVCPQCGSKQVICGKKASFCQRWCQGKNK